MRLRQSINDNLADILSLHDEILGDLHRVVPDSELYQFDSNCPQPRIPKRRRSRRRGRSLDAVPEYETASWLRDTPGMVSDPQVAADAAKVFTKKVCPGSRQFRQH